jgi:hypothetical protein
MRGRATTSPLPSPAAAEEDRTRFAFVCQECGETLRVVDPVEAKAGQLWECAGGSSKRRCRVDVVEVARPNVRELLTTDSHQVYGGDLPSFLVES